MEQYFILDGILKRVVTNPEGKEMILRFADERDMETSYAAWRLGTPTPYGIVCVTKARVARLPLPEWVDFLERHLPTKELFEYDVMQLMSEIMAHTITLHLLDAPGRVHRFLRKHPELRRTHSEEGTGGLPEPVGRDAEPAEQARQDLKPTAAAFAQVSSWHELNSRELAITRSWLSTAATPATAAATFSAAASLAGVERRCRAA